MNKRGIVFDELLMIIVTIIFCSILFFAVYRTSDGIGLQEQIYAKQIALIIDNSEPGMMLDIDFQRGKEISEKNNFPFEKSVNIDSTGNTVTVSLSPKSGYSFNYFSDNEVNLIFLEESISLEVLNKNE